MDTVQTQTKSTEVQRIVAEELLRRRMERDLEDRERARRRYHAFQDFLDELKCRHMDTSVCPRLPSGSASAANDSEASGPEPPPGD